MSTSTGQLVASSAAVERRFYPRIAPSAVVCIAFGDANPGMLLNVSENGLLVSAPLGLMRNSVCRLSLQLNGLPSSIEVIGRIVWTTESNGAGIQLLDLRDCDREQIRKWGRLESAQNADSEQAVVQEDSKLMQEDRSVQRLKRKRTFTRLSLAACAAMVVVVLAMGLTSRGSPLRSWLSHSSKAATKKTTSTRGGGNSSIRRIDAELPASDVSAGKTPRGEAASSTVNGANQSAAASNVRIAQGTAGKNAASSTNSFLAPPISEDLQGKKSVVKTNSASDSKRAATIIPSASVTSSSSNAVDSSSRQFAAHSPVPESPSSHSKESGTVSNIPGSGDVATKKPSNDVLLDDSAKSSAISNPSHPDNVRASVLPENSSIRVDPRAPLQPAASARTSPIEASDSSVIRTEVPKSRVLEVTLPNSRTAVFLGLPGERVIQSPSITVHMQRSILVPGALGRWSSSRNKEVLLGELRSRVDLQTPPFQIEPGARVSVRAILAKDGHVERLQPVHGSITLVPSVARAIREWRFEPTLLDGRPVETKVFVLVEFHPPMGRASKP